MSIFVFKTKLEGEEVTAHLQYESDQTGVYNSEIVKVIYENHDVVKILAEETLYELDGIGLYHLDKQDD